MTGSGEGLFTVVGDSDGLQGGFVLLLDDLVLRLNVF